jgi:hypothetical protein
VPEDARADLREQTVSWTRGGRRHQVPLLPERIYMAPSGYKFRMAKHPAAPSWRLIGSTGEGLFCHKPCTVSGGGKSEISKPIGDYMQYGPVFVADFATDAAMIDEILARDYSDRWKPEVLREQRYDRFPSRPILSEHRSLGSVIKLLTPSDEYTDAYNAWLRQMPSHVRVLVFAIKRFHDPRWTDDWKAHFSVDTVNGAPGHELKLHDRKLGCGRTSPRRRRCRPRTTSAPRWWSRGPGSITSGSSFPPPRAASSSRTASSASSSAPMTRSTGGWTGRASRTWPAATILL